MNQVQPDSLMNRLPQARPFTRRLGHDYAFSDQYGAFVIAAWYCGIAPFFLPPPGIWQHGCFGPWDQVSAGTILYHSPAVDQMRIFVARKDECQFLENNGIKNCSAIGLPFVYAPQSSVRRKKGTLLVVPVHTIAGQNYFSGDGELGAYARQIAQMRKHFSEVILCVHRGDYVNNNWIQQFAKVGIPYVIGADPDDLNSLARVKQLFSMCEYVTTNGWGSHVAYALSCGAKCSIWGPRPSADESVRCKDVGTGTEADRKARSADSVRQARDEYLKGLFVCPRDGRVHQDLGRFLIGESNKRTPRELFEELQWDKVSLSGSWKSAMTSAQGYVQSKSRRYSMLIPQPIRAVLKRSLSITKK